MANYCFQKSLLAAVLSVSSIQVHAEAISPQNAFVQTIPVTSLLYNYTSRFSNSQAQVFNLAIKKVLAQLNCSSDINFVPRSTIEGISGMTKQTDSNKSEISVTATCSQPYSLRFNTLTTELSKTAHLKPDLLFLNGRLVRLQGEVGSMHFSDGEVISSENIGDASKGYSSHPSKTPKLSHIDNAEVMRSTMAQAGFKIGVAGVAIGAPLFIIGTQTGVYNAGLAVFRALNLLKSPAFKVWETIYYNEAYSAIGAASAGAGLFMALISFPTNADAGDLDSRYRQPEFQSEMMTSLGYQNLVAHFGPQSNKIVQEYLANKSVRSVASKYAKSEDDKNALISFYNWWQ